MGSSWTWADLELGSPGTSHCCISLCKCVLTGPGNRVLVRHTSHSSLLLTLQVCSDWSWQQSTGQAHTLTLSLLVSTGHHCWSNGGWAPHGPGQTWNWQTCQVSLILRVTHAFDCLHTLTRISIFLLTQSVQFAPNEKWVKVITLFIITSCYLILAPVGG